MPRPYKPSSRVRSAKRIVRLAPAISARCGARIRRDEITTAAAHARTNKLAPTLHKCAGKISARSRLRITLRAGRMPASAHRYCLGMDAAVETQSQTGWQHELYDLLR